MSLFTHPLSVASILWNPEARILSWSLVLKAQGIFDHSAKFWESGQREGGGII